MASMYGKRQVGEPEPMEIYIEEVTYVNRKYRKLPDGKNVMRKIPVKTSQTD
jgi:hypothetical protein